MGQGSAEGGRGSEERPLAELVLETGLKYASLNVANLAAALLAGIITARILGPELLGVWSTATIVLAYVPFLTLGVDHGAAQEIPLHRGAERLDESAAVRRVYFWFAMPVAVLAALGVVGFALMAPISGSLRGSLLVVAMLGVLASIVRWAVILLKAEHRFTRAGFTEAIRSVVLVIGTPLVLLAGLPGLWASQVAGSLASVAVSWPHVGALPAWCWDSARLRRLIAFGLPIMFVSIAQVLSVTGDKILVLTFLGTSALGLYGLSRTFTQVLMVSGGIVGPVIYPRITERLGQTGDPRTLERLVVAPTLVLGVLLPPAVTLGWFGVPVVVRWLLPAFQGAIPPAQVLFVAAAAYLIAGVSDYLLVAVRRQVLSLVLYAGAVVLGLALEYAALWANLGLTGVASGVAISNLIYAVVVIAVAQRHCGIGWSQITRTVIESTVPLIATVAVCILLDDLIPVPANASLSRGLSRAAAAIVVLSVASFLLTRHALDRAWPTWRPSLSGRILTFVRGAFHRETP